mgnify:CR=1 FL=1
MTCCPQTRAQDAVSTVTLAFPERHNPLLICIRLRPRVFQQLLLLHIIRYYPSVTRTNPDRRAPKACQHGKGNPSKQNLPNPTQGRARPGETHLGALRLSLQKAKTGRLMRNLSF